MVQNNIKYGRNATSNQGKLGELWSTTKVSIFLILETMIFASNKLFVSQTMLFFFLFKDFKKFFFTELTNLFVR